MRQRGCGARAGLIAGLTVAAIAACPGSALGQTPGAPVVPIPDPERPLVPGFDGTTATPNPVGGPAPPRNPFMAPNPHNNIHDDPYMSDTYRVSGPLGDGVEPSAYFPPGHECGSITFDSQGRIVTVCVGLDRPVLVLLDPHSLQVLAALPLPPRNVNPGGNPFTDFSGGGYFYLDQRNRAVLPTNDRHILVVSTTSAPGFGVDADYDLSNVVPPGEGIVSVLPDWSGRLWFVTRQGIVGTIDRGSGKVRTKRLSGEGISNSFAVDETGGVYIVSDKALYRFDANSKGGPRVSWRIVYPNSGIHKPGQSDAGSGTTPTLMGGKWVAITDNADPMNVEVYRRALRLKGKKKGKGKAKARRVCSAPVFAQGASATDNSLIGTNRSLIAENNYGYRISAADLSGGVSSPGLTRIDVVKKKAKGAKKGGKRKRPAKFRCRTAWTSEERAPSVVPKLSLANGLVYTYTHPQRSDGIDSWYLTALDYRSGRTVYRRLAGTGFGFNNNYAPVTLGPDGTAYVGVLGGVVAFP
ncbi:MAG TPA: hypothetical protein VFN72_08105 [Solirubrobacterales bacterium]|nr:hypothetical protein [Solirubrobacterales bacterium]